MGEKKKGILTKKKLEEGRCVVINPFLIEPVPWGTNAEHNQTSTKEKY